MSFDPDKFLAGNKEPFDPDRFLGVQPEEPGIGSQALDYGMRALDYAGGLTRTGVAAAADPFVDADLVNEQDVMAALKGKAPGTSEFLDRSGMEEGALRTGLGFVGDVTLDPTTYMTGGISALSKLAKMGKAGKVAAAVTAPTVASSALLGKGLEKTLGKAYQFGTRKIAPRIAEATSGVNKNALKSYIQDPKTAHRISEAGEEMFANESLMDLWGKVQGRKKEIGSKMISEIRGSSNAVDIKPVKNLLDKNISDLYKKQTITPAETDYLNKLLSLKNELFTGTNPKTGEIFKVGDVVSADKASSISDSIKALGDVAVDPGTLKTTGSKRQLGTIRGLGAQMSGQIKEAIPEASSLKREFSAVMKDEKFVSENFKNSKKIDPKFDGEAFNKKGVRNLGKINTSSKKGLADNVHALDLEYGTNLIKDSDAIKASRQLVDPQITAMSGGGGTSTSKTMVGSSLAALLAHGAGVNPAIAYTVAPAVGAVATGPMAVKTAATGLKGAENLISKIPAKKSMFQRMMINQNREE